MPGITEAGLEADSYSEVSGLLPESQDRKRTLTFGEQGILYLMLVLVQEMAVKIPKRWLYPVSEANNNTVNYKAALATAVWC